MIEGLDFLVFGEFDNDSRIVFCRFLWSFGIVVLVEFDSLVAESFDESLAGEFGMGFGVGGVKDFSFLASSPMFAFQFVFFKS